MEDLTVKCFDEQGAEAELKDCPEIVQDYVKKLKGSRDNWKNICADAVSKLRNLSKNNDVSHVVINCTDLDPDFIEALNQLVNTQRKPTKKRF